MNTYEFSTLLSWQQSSILFNDARISKENSIYKK